MRSAGAYKELQACGKSADSSDLNQESLHQQFARRKIEATSKIVTTLTLRPLFSVAVQLTVSLEGANRINPKTENFSNELLAELEFGEIGIDSSEAIFRPRAWCGWQTIREPTVRNHQASPVYVLSYVYSHIGSGSSWT